AALRAPTPSAIQGGNGCQSCRSVAPPTWVAPQSWPLPPGQAPLRLTTVPAPELPEHHRARGEVRQDQHRRPGGCRDRLGCAALPIREYQGSQQQRTKGEPRHLSWRPCHECQGERFMGEGVLGGAGQEQEIAPRWLAPLQRREQKKPPEG